MDNTILIPKRKLKGEDGHTTFSIRIPVELCKELDRFAGQTELSRNEVITILLRESLRMARIEEDED